MFVEHKEAMEVTEAPAKVLKLSEAMRLGAEIRPQCQRHLYDGKRSCAIGAIYEATFGELPSSIQYGLSADYQRLQAHYKQLNNEVRGERLMTTIFRRNDAGWTREAIADWLEAQGF